MKLTLAAILSIFSSVCFALGGENIASTTVGGGSIEKSSAEANAAIVSNSGTDISSLSNWPIVLLTLFGMIVLIFALAWFARRFGGFNFAANRDMRVISAITVGARERVALIDVKGHQFLIGVTNQQISHLHSFDSPVVDSNPVGKEHIGNSDFALKLQAMLKGNLAPKPKPADESKSDA